MHLRDICELREGRRTKRIASWDTKGGNKDFIVIEPKSTVTIADIEGPGILTHFWITQDKGLRDSLIKITWDHADEPSVLCPLGDFFGVGHGIATNYQSLLFSCSVNKDIENTFKESFPALNSYVPMPFKQHAKIELINDSDTKQMQYFYIDYEEVPAKDVENKGYFHSEFRRCCPYPGWGHDMLINTDAVNIPNLEKDAWDNNYVILETKGKGHYLGCNMSITNLKGTDSWWGEGDDMIWVDGYKWPPDLHGTGTEDYFGQAMGMQPNAYLRNGSSVYLGDTLHYHTTYVHHLENPVYFNEEIKVTMEIGHANRLANEVSTVAYWYATEPTGVVTPPPVEKRQPIQVIRGSLVIKEEQICQPQQLRKTEDMENSIANYPKELEQIIKGEKE